MVGAKAVAKEFLARPHVTSPVENSNNETLEVFDFVTSACDHACLK